MSASQALAEGSIPSSRTNKQNFLGAKQQIGVRFPHPAQFQSMNGH